ncbi:MAG TPA: bifunctional polysaccharide deacetylase/glycosyltransferase family 2 protein [Streptosporangiaceae bacterium]|nr:bifunctional polysaccharide deacetylase/glycosyltransferase family 2 protein [Streptosporangiaceae bacterium]
MRRPDGDRKRLGRLRLQWLLTGVLLLTFAAALSVNGLVHGHHSQDNSAGSPAVSSDAVPKKIAQDRPVINGAHKSQVAYKLPRKTIVLSFDDGPDATWTPQILDVLRKYRVPATFFVVGSAVVRHPDIVRDMRRAGAEIGIHTFTHANMTKVSNWQRQKEMTQTQLGVVGAAGVKSSLMRPPYSSTTAAIDNPNWRLVQDLGRQGYVTALTSADTRDWSKPGIAEIVRNGTPKDGKGEIALLHDAGGDRSQTVAALDQLIPKLQAQGYRFTTVSQIIHQQTNQPADAAEQARGFALLAMVRTAIWIDLVMAGFLLVVGILVPLRLVLMLTFAGRHARRRRSGRWSWGPPVTEPVSVIVPAYNERECIADTVRSVRDSDHPLEVVVVDDGSTDGTADIVEGLGLPDVRVIRQPNSGKAAALNTGIAAARHELIVMLDGDTIFQPDTVRRLVQPFADHRVGGVAGNAKVANRHRGLLARWQHIEYVVGFNIDRRMYDLLGCMATVPGAVGAFRRRALRTVGGVSDDTLAEDTDLTMGVVRSGWQVVYEPAAVAWTEAPASLGELWRQRYRWSYGTMQSMWKHRRALIERGASGRFGRIGLTNLALFQVALPLMSPLIDVGLLYGLLFLDPLKTVMAWLAVLGVQAAGAVVALRMDREPLRQLWVLPLQQVVYRQIMYGVLIQSMIMAVGGMRLRWQKLRRVGGLSALTGDARRAPAEPGPEPAAAPVANPGGEHRERHAARQASPDRV